MEEVEIRSECDLTGAESRRLTGWLRNSRNGIQMRRAQIIAFSGQGLRVQEIAANLEMNEEYIRELIRNFNDEGFDALRRIDRLPDDRFNPLPSGTAPRKPWKTLRVFHFPTGPKTINYHSESGPNSGGRSP